MYTVGVISQKGGSGKTTTLLNLSCAAQEDDKAALIVDLDLQASATDWSKARESDAPLVQPTHPAGLAGVLKAAEGQGIDAVFIDTAAKTESDAVTALEASDLVLITCRPSIMDLRAIQNTLRLCRHREVTPYVVLTQVEPQGTVAEESRAALEQLGAAVVPETLGRRVAFHYSLIGGQAVTEYEPKGKAAEEVRALYRRIRLLAGKPSRHHAITEPTHTKAEVPA